MTATLTELRAEHQASFIGPELQRLLERVATATLRTYPPSYTPAGVWTAESIADVLHDWALARLIERRDLTKLLAGASSVAALRAGLTTSLRQYITNQQERTSATNLYERTGKLLRSSPEFQRVGSAPKAHEQLWTLAAAPQTAPCTLGLRERTIVAFELTDQDLGVVTYKSTKRSSPILRAPALKRFVIHLLDHLGPLTPADIMQIMRRRFGLVDPETVELDEGIERRGYSVHDQISQQQIVSSVVARLGGDRARLLSALGEHANLKAAAMAAGTEEMHVQRAYAEMEEMVITQTDEPDQVDHICGLIIESLFGDSE